MIIEQVDALKVWLTNKLSPICDAEPSALAKYVCALVKKDKQEQDLRDICVDQLDVFLQQNTKPFVDELFEVLKSKIYIPPASEPKPRPPPPIPVVKTESKSPSHQTGKEKEDGLKKKVSEISSTTDDKEFKDTSLALTTPLNIPTTTLSSAKELAVESKAVKDPPREVREPRATSRDARDKERDEDSSRDRRDSWKEDRSRDGIRDTRDGLRDARDGNKETRDGVRDARDGIRDARDGIKDARDGFRDSRDGIKDGINHSRDGIRDSRDGVRDTRDGVKDLREATRDVRDGNRDFRDGNRDFRDGHKDFRDGNRDTKDGIRESRDGVKDARDGVKDARDGVKDARDGVKDARDGVSIRDARDIIRDRERDKLDLKQDTREVREPRDRDYRDRDFRRRRTRSRSYSPRRRDFDADRRRRFEERPRYSPDRRWGRRRSYSRSPRRNRSPFDRNIVRPRSRSPRLRSRSPRYRPFRSRTRSRTRSRSPRPRSWSRPGSGARARTKSPSNTRLPDSRGSTPLQDNDFISSSTNDLPPTVTSIVGYRPQGEDRGDGLLPVHFDGPPPSFVQGGRVHCQNFEEKGFCTLGDDCPFDHGPDPVVVENMSLPNVLPGASNTGGFVPPDMRVPPPGHMGVRINVQRPPPPMVEPYLPEAPGLKKLSFMHLPPPVLVPNRPPQEHFYVPSREVIMNHPPHLEEGDLLDMVNAGPEKEPSRIVIPAKRPYSAISGDSNVMNIGPPPPRMALLSQASLMFENPPMLQPPFPTQIPAPPRRSFDYNRLGMRARLPVPRPQFRPGNLTLEVRKVPHEFNNIAKLNEHFGKFGNLTNIQVKFQGDPGAALITFSNSSEANAAYRSPEPVFNNRFIKLFWHNAEKHINLDGETESPVVVTVGEDGRNVQIQQTTVTGGRVGDGIDHPSLMLPVRPSIPPAHKLQLDNTKAKTNSTVSVTSDASTTTPSPTTDKSIVYTSSIGNLKKTVFNPAATINAPAKSKTNAPIVSPTAVKTADHVSRMEAISRAEEERKLAAIKQAELEQKRQELLAKQIQQQKILLDTLEKKKATMSEEEKKDLWKALRTISDAIDKVKYGTGAKRPQPTTFQPPVPDQFKYVSSHEQIVHYGRGRGWPGGRTPGWTQRGRGHMTQFLNRTHLDNRPKTIEVKGFELSELDEIKQHFQRFGEIDKVDVVEVVPSIFLTYASRPSAEVAVSQGGKFKKKTLIVRWNQVTPKITRTESNQSSELDEDLSITLGSLNEDSLADAGGEDKSEEVSSSLFTSATPQEKEKDLSVLEEQSPHTGEDLAVRAAKPIFERSLSEDLLATGEEHFKASYTDDDDEEDHITVTLSNVISSAPPPYSSNSSYSSSALLGQEAISKDILEEEHNSGLDYSDDGPWV